MTSTDDAYDVLGLGFGPANLAVAIALSEAEQTPGAARFSSVHLEAQNDPVWQGGMLLEGSNIQNHPSRDLVTPRNPRSHYSFLNYLFHVGRLFENLNSPGEFPLRSEYAAYVDWARRHFDDVVRYGEVVTDVTLDETADEPLFVVSTTDGVRYRARCVLAGPGRSPRIPPPFATVEDPRVFHFTEYLYRLQAFSAPPDHVVVVGGSQSAVEIALDLDRRYPAATVRIVLREVGLRLKDTSPFSEEGFFPQFTDRYFRAERHRKDELDRYMRLTNYSSADDDVLHELYLRMQEQRIRGHQRLFVDAATSVDRVQADAQGVWLELHDADTGVTRSACTDVVVLATGFRDLGPHDGQERLPPAVRGLEDHIAFDEDGYPQVGADYRLLGRSERFPPLYLNGLCETSHGIGDAGSFSLLSLRAEVITRSLSSALVAGLGRNAGLSDQRLAQTLSS